MPQRSPALLTNCPMLQWEATQVVATVSILLLFRLVVSNAAELGIPALKSLLNRARSSGALVIADAKGGSSFRAAGPAPSRLSCRR